VVVIESERRADDAGPGPGRRWPGRRPGRSARVGRRRRGLLLLCCLLVLALAAALGWFVVVPRYRPPLQAGEQYGIDVSNHQGAIDWPAVAGDDISAAYIKATEGQTFVDERFAENWAGAASAGVRRGAYHFFSLCSPGAAQAANFLRVVPKDADALPPALDLEWGPCEERPDKAAFQREVTAFIETVERELGKPVVLYAMPSFTDTYPVPEQFVRDTWVRRLFQRPERPGWSLWQVSDRARVHGIGEPVDLNVWRGQRT
jgi:lysozyme